MTWTLNQANLLSPDTIMNDIVRDLAQLTDTNRGIVNEVFPLVQMDDSVVTHFTMDGLRHGMPRTGLASEAPIADLESLGTKDVEVFSYKEKISPEKGANTELNTDQEIMNLYELARTTLREDLLLTRAKAAWQGDSEIDGLIGTDGASAHSDLDSSHVLTPGTAYSTTGSATPITDFVTSERLISEDGVDLGTAGPITAYMSPSTLQDLKLNNDIQSEYENVRALSEQQLVDALQIDRIQQVRTQLPRRNSNGEFVNSSGTVVQDPTNAARDNVLDPHDGSNVVRNIVVTAPGQQTAFMPWLLDRLAERVEGLEMGEFAVDATNGFLTRAWMDVDTTASWFEIGQEIGFHLRAPGNAVVIQDI